MPTRTVRVKDVTLKSTSKGDLYELVDDDDNKYATKKRDVAESARDLIGNQAEIEFTESRNGQWLNLWLESVLPPKTAPSNGFTQITNQAPDMSPAREGRIMREAAAKVAIQHLAYLPQDEQSFANLLALADWWFDYFLNGSEGVTGPPDISVAVASQAPAPDDDIPF